MLTQVTGYRAVVTEVASTEGTSDDQNIVVLILGAVLGVALIVVLTTIILLATICYRNKVSFSIVAIS